MSGSHASDKVASATDESRSDGEGDHGSASDNRGPPTMCLTSDEVNYLIFRYVHSRVIASLGSPYIYVRESTL